MDKELHFDILDDLSEELSLPDYYQFMLINDPTSELNYKIIRIAEYYYEAHWDHIVGACTDGDLRVVKWFYDIKKESRDLYVFPRYGNGQRSRFLYSLNGAIINGNLELVQYVLGVIPHLVGHLKYSERIADKYGLFDIQNWLKGKIEELEPGYNDMIHRQRSHFI